MFRKIISFPFAVVGAIVIGTALAIRYGLENGGELLDRYTAVTQSFKQEKGIK